MVEEQDQRQTKEKYHSNGRALFGSPDENKAETEVQGLFTSSVEAYKFKEKQERRRRRRRSGYLWKQHYERLNPR